MLDLYVCISFKEWQVLYLPNAVTTQHLLSSLMLFTTCSGM